MKRILERHDDVGVLAVVLYSDGERLYKDAELNEGLMAEELIPLAYHPLKVVSLEAGVPNVFTVINVCTDPSSAGVWTMAHEGGLFCIDVAMDS